MWYYIKIRFGVISFLERLFKLYEFYIFIMGLRMYVYIIVRMLDFVGKLFVYRIRLRDECFNVFFKFYDLRLVLLWNSNVCVLLLKNVFYLKIFI